MSVSKQNCTTEKRLKCDTSGKLFLSGGAIHVHSHAGEKAIKCGAQFSGSSKFKTHVRIHTREKHFKRDTCGV